jgi:pimeloyl-ACP methyl ester carboxylesterase
VLRQVLLIGAVLIATGRDAAGQARCDEVGPSQIPACVYAGGGPTLVLAAGAGQDSRTWSPLIAPLNARSAVVTFDRPGLGQSPDVEGPRTPTAIARELRYVLTRFRLARLWP